MSSYLDSTGVTRLATDLKAKLAEKEHEHSAADVTSGTLPVARGGTGLTSNPSMLANLGSTTADDVLKASPRPGVTGTLAIANGGTGATTVAGAAENIVDGQDIEPSSVAATGEVSAKSGTGASAVTHNLTDKAEDSRADNLEASIAYVESTTARTNHAIGDYFMLGDVLMKATAAIATGEQITTSNATPATVQGQIDTLRDSVAKTSGNLSDTTIYWSKFGPIVVLGFGGTNPSANMGTMPLGLRPDGATYGVEQTGAYLSIGYDGTLTTSKASGKVWGTIVYLAAH